MKVSVRLKGDRKDIRRMCVSPHIKYWCTVLGQPWQTYNRQICEAWMLFLEKAQFGKTLSENQRLTIIHNFVKSKGLDYALSKK